MSTMQLVIREAVNCSTAAAGYLLVRLAFAAVRRHVTRHSTSIRQLGANDRDMSLLMTPVTAKQNGHAAFASVTYARLAKDSF